MDTTWEDSDEYSEVCRGCMSADRCTSSFALINEVWRARRPRPSAVAPETLANVRLADGLVDEEDVDRLLG